MKKIVMMTACLLSVGTGFAQSSKASLSSTGQTNVSITSSDRDYALIASFAEQKLAEVKKLIEDALGAPTENKEDLSVWISRGIYTITLRSEKLIIDLDKKSAGTALIKKFEKLGEKIGDKVAAAKTK
jgi:hypothetical protein